MSSIRPMIAKDLFNIHRVNLNDEFVTTFATSFYLEYLARWPQYCHVIVDDRGSVEGYIIGKSETSPAHVQPTKLPYDPDTNRNLDYLPWHSHITALAIAPECRRLGHARKLTELFEVVSNREKVWFVDLFVRADNLKALKLYESLGYKPFRKVVEYYQDGMDAYDMRTAMKKDVDKKHIRDEPFDVTPDVVW